MSTQATERNVLRPRDEGELKRLVDDGRAEGARLVPTGLGSSMDWTRTDVDASARFVSTRSLLPDGASGILEYVPGDGTVTALAGTRMSDLRAAVREGGHEITPAIRTDSTLGGVLSAGRSGPDRAAFGPARHHVLGMKVLDGTGRFSRSGGRLVKNVTGFDVFRTYVGARGTLGFVLEASLRLASKPETESHGVFGGFASAEAATSAAMDVRAEPRIRPRAIFVRGTELHVVLAGRDTQVAIERDLVTQAAASDADWRTEEGAAWDAYAAAPERPCARVSTRPSRVTKVTASLERALPDAELYVEPDAAFIDVVPSSVEALAGAWSESILAPFDDDAVVERRFDAPSTIRSTPPRGGATATWTDRIVRAFDPDGLFRADGFPHGVSR